MQLYLIFLVCGLVKLVNITSLYERNIQNHSMEISIYPHNSLSKNSLYLIGFIIFSIFVFFSFIWLSIGAWPITIFMGLEYVVLSTLVFFFFKKRKIKENIKINEKNISYKFYEQEKLKKHINFNTYWSKIDFWKRDNKSKLIVSESGKKIEIGKIIDTKSKERIYFKLNKYFKNYY